MKKIVMKCGATVMIDDADYDEIAAFGWHLSNNGYAIRRVRQKGGVKKNVPMHRQIFGDVEGDIDHIDGDKLNNCRSNLRQATRTLNNANSKPRTGCSSRFKGVAWVKSYGKWWAYINRDGKRNHLGYFDDEVAAAKAYNAAAPVIFGEFARLNTL